MNNAQTMAAFQMLGKSYLATFKASPPQEAFETMTLAEMIAAMEQALESGRPVPGWDPGHETSLPEPLTSSPARDSIAASLRRNF